MVNKGSRISVALMGYNQIIIQINLKNCLVNNNTQTDKSAVNLVFLKRCFITILKMELSQW